MASVSKKKNNKHTGLYLPLSNKTRAIINRNTVPYHLKGKVINLSRMRRGKKQNFITESFPLNLSGNTKFTSLGLGQWRKQVGITLNTVNKDYNKNNLLKLNLNNLISAVRRRISYNTFDTSIKPGSNNLNSIISASLRKKIFRSNLIASPDNLVAYRKNFKSITLKNFTIYKGVKAVGKNKTKKIKSFNTVNRNLMEL